MENDLISRSELLENNGLKDAVKYGNKTREQAHHSIDTLMLYEIADMIESAPTVDAVEVVRCKDCWHHNNCGIEQAALAPIGFFCALGERKDDAK